MKINLKQCLIVAIIATGAMSINAQTTNASSNDTINLTLDGDILTTKVIEGIHSIERRTGRDLLLG